MTALDRGYDGKAYRDLPIREVRMSAADEDVEGEGPGPVGPFISCNGTYLAHALQIAGDDLEIGISRPVDPILIRFRTAGTKITSVLMPVRCNEAPADRFPIQTCPEVGRSCPCGDSAEREGQDGPCGEDTLQEDRP